MANGAEATSPVVDRTATVPGVSVAPHPADEQVRLIGSDAELWRHHVIIIETFLVTALVGFLMGGVLQLGFGIRVFIWALFVLLCLALMFAAVLRVFDPLQGD